MWLNRYEIEEVVNLFTYHPTLGPASRYLRDYMELVNAHSDGWPYWSYGTRCARDLCALLEKARLERIRGNRSEGPTRAEVEKAAKKIRTFMLRCEQWKATGEVPPVLRFEG